MPQVAAAQPGSGGNIVVGDPLLMGYRYEKTIDMTNAPDRTSIPDASFTYTLSTVSSADQQAFGIGTTYNVAEGEHFSVRAGTLANGASSMPFSKVTFRSVDKYWPELEDMIDNGRAEQTLDFIINNAWGEMRSSTHTQTVIVRQATSSELREWKANGGTVNSWPAGMSPWRGFSGEPDRSWLTEEGYYKAETPVNFESGAQLLREYSWPMGYVATFSLHENPAVTYSAYAVRAPYVSRMRTDAGGKLISVTKPLFSPEEYEDLTAALAAANADAAYGTISRYVLTEDAVEAPFAANGQTLVVDYVADGGMLIFNSVEEADSFYRDALAIDAGDSISAVDASQMKNLAPSAGFKNSYEPMTPEDPTPEDPTPENPTPEDPTPEVPEPENPTPEDPEPENPTPGAPTPKPEPKSPVQVSRTRSGRLPKTGDTANVSRLGIVADAGVVLVGGALLLRRRSQVL